MKRSAALFVAVVIAAAPAPAQDRAPSPSRFGASPTGLDGPDPSRFGSPDADADRSGSAELDNPPSETGPDESRFGAADADAAYGAFQRGLYVTARNLALPRAEAGDAAAQTLLAEIYSRGLGVAVDEAEATRWYRLAAAQEVPEAQFRYALTLLRDDLGSAEGRSLMQAAADSGNALAMFNQAQILVTDRPGPAGQEAAFPYFLAAARRGVGDAQYAVAQYYLQGTPPAVADDTVARLWLRRAADRGFDTAQYELGGMMLEGLGGPRDLEAGFVWTARAARAGNIAAQVQLAKLFWGGIGTAPDDIEAAGWYVLARRAGLRDSLLEDFWLGLSPDARRRAIERANRLGGS